MLEPDRITGICLSLNEKEIMKGEEIGEVCNRNGCQGIISEHDTDSGCSCHISPPCSYCTTPREYCPECDWDAKDERDSKYVYKEPTAEQKERWRIEDEKEKEADRIWQKKLKGEIPVDKVEWIYRSHTHASMIKEGVFPVGWSRKQVEEVVIGTFGGRFEHFGEYTFKYIAYTD